MGDLAPPFPQPHRSLVIGALGALLGLTIAGYGLFTAGGTELRQVPAEDAALVNQRPILQSDVEAQAHSALGLSLAAATPDQRRKLLDDMIREELLVQRGLALDEPSIDPDTRAALVAAVQQEVAVNATSRIPSELQLREYFSQNKDKYSSVGVMTLRDLVPATTYADVKAAVRLESAVAALKRGEPIATVMAQYALADFGAPAGQHPPVGERLYFAAKIDLGDALFDAASRLADGEVSITKFKNEPHILVMLHNQPPRLRSFDVSRSQVYSDYKAEQQATMLQAEYSYLRSSAAIKIAPSYR